MSDGYEEDLAMYEEAASDTQKQLDNRVLRRPISDLKYPIDPEWVSPETPVGEALATMTNKGFGALLVLDGGKVAGIFTERDALKKGLYQGTDLGRPVSDFMTADPDCLTPMDAIAHALNRMSEGGYRHMPIIDPSGKPIGVLVMRDVTAYIASFFPEEVLNAPPHSEHNPPDRDVVGG
ncbi:MAG: CBS domain-containing protein [Planctomycetota bacterium]